MKIYDVYIAHSTQGTNIGVGKYGTEQNQMTRLAARTIYWLTTQKRFRCRTNRKGYTLSQTAKSANSFAPDIFIDNHTDAGPSKAQGTTVFYDGTKAKGRGYKLANLVYKAIAPLSPGKDRGVKPDTSLYSTGLYIIQNVNYPSCLVEHIFHSNAAEVKDFLSTIDDYAKAEAKAICKYFDITWKEPK